MTRATTHPVTPEGVFAILEQDNWFAALPAALKDAIVRHGCVRSHKAGELLFAAGDEPDGLYALLSGQINLVSHTCAGRQITQGVHRPGAWFGYLALLDARPHCQDAATAGPARTLRLNASVFRRLLRDTPAWHQHFTRLLCDDVRLILAMLVDSLTSPLSSRLASTLLDMSAVTPDSRRPAPRLTQETLAGMVGASRQTVNRQLRDWQARNIIRLGYGVVTVVDRAALASAAHGDAGFRRADHQVA